MIKYNKIRNFWLYFVLYSIFGYFFEIILYIIKEGKLVNRGYLYGPYLTIYGFGAIIIVNLLNNLKSKKIKFLNINITPIIIFILIMIITSFTEYITHYTLEKAFNIKLWDYSNQFMNINGRICLIAETVFAVAGIILLYLIQPKISNFMKKANDKKKNILFITTFFIITSDFFVKTFTKLIK